MGNLDPKILEHFETQGFVVVENVLDPEKDLYPVIEEYTSLVDELAKQLYLEGKLSSTYSNLSLGQRLIQITAETGRVYSAYFDISLPQSNVTEETPIHLGPAVFHLLRHPKLLDVVESFIGPEIYCNPVQHVRIKLPYHLVPEGQRNGLSTAVAWHQDNGVILPEADESNILTVWLPLTEVTEDNGCLEVIPGSHKTGFQPHCPSPILGVHIPDHYLPAEAIPVPMKQGSILLMSQRTIHRSRENITQDEIRWSFDLRYNPIGQPTGRPSFPGFVARSHAHPEQVLTDPEVWAQLWRDARTRLARSENPVYNRWKADAPWCA